MIKDFMKVTPLKILEKSSHKKLGHGNLGVLMARAGVGKTACLIHIAFDKLFRGKKLVHVSLEDVPEKVTSYYKVILKDLLKVLKIENELELVALLEKNRMILAYLSQSFDIERLRDNLKNLVEYTQFMPNTLIIDGLDFEKAGRDLFEGFKGIALEFNTEIWFSALSHRHITDVNERGVPYPCNDLDDLFSIILQLQPTQSGISMRLLKDHESPVISDTGIRLDPNTFLVMG